MNPMKTAALALATSVIAMSAGAATLQFDVQSREHALAASPVGGLATGIRLAEGQEYSVTASADDYWMLGEGLNRIINANGDSLTGRPEFGSYTDATSGQSFVYGQLVGRIGGGDYFLLGTSFAGTAANTGELFLLNWDSGNADNEDSILATVTTVDAISAVPLPASGLFLLGALAGAGSMARRSKKTA